MDHFYQDIFGWFDFQDLYSEVVANASEGANFVEVGCFKGKSSAYMAVEIANSGKRINFDCVDTWLGSAEHQRGGEAADTDVINGRLFAVFQQNMTAAKGYYNPIRMPSVTAAGRYDDNKLDFVYIDASHDFDSVFNDLTAWYPKVKTGGIIAGHDRSYPPVAQALAAYFGKMPEVRGSSWIVKK